LRTVAGSQTAQEFEKRLASLIKAKFRGNISSSKEKEWLPRKEVKNIFIYRKCMQVCIIY